MKNKIMFWIFGIECAIFVLVVLSILPREFSLFVAVGLSIYALLSSLENSTILFVMSIPLFLALPITTNFDNFNTWRIISVIIFLKWIYQEKLDYIKNLASRPAQALFSTLEPVFSVPILLLLVTAVLSIIPAPDKLLAVKRIIYFLNLSLIGVVIYDLAQKNEVFVKKIIKIISVPIIVVTIAGFVQLVSTYFIDIYQFMRIWGEGIQCRQFGNQWCDIAVQLGNTWFAYYGEQLSLRVFSLFPDSHSFPQFILLGLLAIFAIALSRFELKNFENLKKMLRTRTSLIIVWVPLVFLIAILSGTRGIWAASVGVLIFSFLVVWRLVVLKSDQRHINLFKYISSYLVLFFLLFAIAYPIFISPQFLLSKGDWGLLGNRIRSIIDFGETSNSQRIEIWGKSLSSIKEKPLLGVGIGNFPVVLGQDLFLSKAGSSAHNLYLQIASEMGLPALVIFMWFIFVLFNKTLKNFMSSGDVFVATYFGASLLFIPWILIYSLTDVALFDERAFLLFVTTTTLIFATKK